MMIRIHGGRWGNCFKMCFYCMNQIGLKKMQVKTQCVRKYTYRAMTLPELLVVMVVGGIVLLMVFEAWNRVGCYGKQQTERSLSESTFFTSVSRLEALCMSADSIIVRGDELVVHRSAGNKVGLYREGDCLVVLFEDGDDCISALRDTLFRNVDAVRWTVETDVPKRIDSLYVLLRLGRHRKEFGFGCTDRGPERWGKIFQAEENR